MTCCSSICSRIPQRWVLSIMSGIVMIAKYSAMASYGVTIVAMVNGTDTSSRILNANFGLHKNRSVSNEMVTAYAPVYHWSREMQDYILSAYYYGSFPLRIIGGNIAQRYGGKWIVAGGIFGMAILDLVKPVSAMGGPYVMIVVMAVQGLASSMIWSSIFAMYGRWVPPQEISVLSASTDIGTAVGQFLGLAISGPICASAALGGWPTVFYLHGSLNLVALILWCALVSNSPDDHPFISPDELQYIQESLKSNQQVSNEKGVPWSRILLSRVTVGMVITAFEFGWVMYMASTVLPQYFSDVLHLPIDHNSVFLSITTMAKPIGSVICSRAFDYIIRREWVQKNCLRKFYAAVGAIGIVCVYITISTTRLDTPIVISLLTVGMMIWSLSSLTYCVLPLDLSPEYSGTLSGISGIFVMLGGGVMPMVIGNMTTHGSENEWNSVFYLSCGVVATSTLTFILFGTSERQYQWNLGDVEDSSKHKNANEEQPLFMKKISDSR